MPELKRDYTVDRTSSAYSFWDTLPELQARLDEIGQRFAIALWELTTTDSENARKIASALHQMEVERTDWDMTVFGGSHYWVDDFDV